MNNNLIRSLVLAGAVVILVTAVALVRNSRAEARKRNTEPAAPAITQEALPRMIDLGADKCIPCKQMAPILAELKTEYAGQATIEFIDVWKNPDAGRQYGIRIIPTQIFYDRGGKEVWRHEGFLGRAEIVARLTELGAG